MSVTRKSRSIVMTAANDEVTGKIYATSIRLSGTGMTLGQQCTITETDGARIADHFVGAANQSEELLTNPQWFDGIKISAMPAAGSPSVTILYK